MLCTLLDQEGAVYRVLEHEAEGRTEFITKIRGNKIEQAIKSMVVQVRMTRKENLYYLANVPGDCRVDFDAIKMHFKADSVGMAGREKAEALTGCRIRSKEDMQTAAQCLYDLGCPNVLIKGGHLPGQPVDLLFGKQGGRFLEGTRIETRHTHGTGCVYSAAITAGLALGRSLAEAVSQAKEFVQRAIETAPGLGAGNGPLNFNISAR